MKRIKDKQYAIIAALLVFVLLFTPLYTSCGLKPSEHDPAGSDGADTPPASTPADTEQATYPNPSDADTSEPVTGKTPDAAETTDPDQTQEPESPTDTQAQIPENTTGESEESGDPESTAPGEETTPPQKPTYEEYCAMTSQEQMDFFNSFADIDDYFLWFEWAKADYEERHPGIEIGPDGIITP